MAYTTIDDPSAYFQTHTYTGNQSAHAETNTGLSDLQPDLIWFKNIAGGGFNHYMYNSTFGVGKNLRPDIDDAEGADAGQITAFNSDGFSLATGCGANCSNAMVAWQWNANDGSTSSNTDGSGTSTIQVNSTSKFCIMSMNSASNGTTFGHGLGVKPGFAVLKDRESSSGWYTFFPITQGSNQSTAISGDGAFGTVSGFSNFTDTLVTQATSAGNDMVGYLWGDVQGYSDFGVYRGNGDANGAFVYTGFKPAWLLVKQSNASGEHWRMFDHKRSPYNPVNKHLVASTGGGESQETGCDFLSNGFKLRDGDTHQNGSGADYVYAAFAENPFVTSTGIPCTAR